MNVVLAAEVILHGVVPCLAILLLLDAVLSDHHLLLNSRNLGPLAVPLVAALLVASYILGGASYMVTRLIPTRLGAAIDWLPRLLRGHASTYDRPQNDAARDFVLQHGNRALVASVLYLDSLVCLMKGLAWQVSVLLGPALAGWLRYERGVRLCSVLWIETACVGLGVLALTLYMRFAERQRADLLRARLMLEQAQRPARPGEPDDQVGDEK